MKQGQYKNIRNILFFSMLPIISIVGTTLLCYYSKVSWPTWMLAGCFYLACGLVLSAGYHRLFSHRAYSAPFLIRFLFMLIGSAKFEGSVLEWAVDHRNHHLYSDTEKDPYSITKGFWHAHMGWIFTLDESKRDYSNVKDLEKSAMLRLQHKYYLSISCLMGFVVPAAIAALWGEALAGLIVAGGLRITLGHHSTFCINSLCHFIGKSPYSNKITARDNWLSALVTFGEGYHNYHHQFPLDYRNGVRFHQFDPAKWFIFSLSHLGLASRLHRIPHHRIIQARIEAHRQSYAMQYRSTQNQTAKYHKLEQLQESMLRLIASIKEFERALVESDVTEYSVKIKAAKKELTMLFSQWKDVLVLT